MEVAHAPRHIDDEPKHGRVPGHAWVSDQVIHRSTGHPLEDHGGERPVPAGSDEVHHVGVPEDGREQNLSAEGSEVVFGDLFDGLHGNVVPHALPVVHGPKGARSNLLGEAHVARIEEELAQDLVGLFLAWLLHDLVDDLKLCGRVGCPLLHLALVVIVTHVRCKEKDEQVHCKEDAANGQVVQAPQGVRFDDQRPEEGDENLVLGHIRKEIC
mmetsp:Transcript_24488/g.71830  ORF Transcript_24488/g.71830 Transcript_24488/m.71830 type:complete len:213 (+) Transcript_24488:422-1060(+)